MLMRHYEHF